MGGISSFKKFFSKFKNKKFGSKNNNLKQDSHDIDALKKQMDECTKKIEGAIENKQEKEFINILKDFTADLEKILNNTDNSQDSEVLDFCNLCRVLKGVIKNWYTSSPRFSEEEICFIYTILTQKNKQSFYEDIQKVRFGTSVKLDIKTSDKSINNNVKKSLKNFLLSLMKIYSYGGDGIKEFTKEVEPIEDSDKNNTLKGGIGLVHKIQYKGKDNKIKKLAMKNLQSQYYVDGQISESGLSNISKSKLVEDTFKEYKRKYKKLKKEKSRSGAEEYKDKFRNIALQKVRKEDGEFVMISKWAEGDLSKFYYLDKSNDKNIKDPNPVRKLDNEKKVYQLFHDLTAGVDQLHKMGLVHGDIKPTNILGYNAKNGDLKYKITDFDTVTNVENYKDSRVHTYNYIPKCYKEMRIPNGEEAKKVDCYAICYTLREIFGKIENFGVENPQSLQKYAEGLVAKYEKEHSCSKDSFKQEPSPKESSSLNS